MARNRLPSVNSDTIDQLGGVTGIGWTTAFLGYLAPLVGYGNGLVGRVVTDPQSLLYVGVVCFLATVGLDRLANALPDG